MQLDQIQHKMNLLHAELDRLQREMADGTGFMTNEQYALRLRSLGEEEDRLDDEWLKLEVWD